MSTRKRRAAFDPNALNDLDDLLPPINLVRDAAAAGGNTASRAGSDRTAPSAKARTDLDDNNADGGSATTEPAESSSELDVSKGVDGERSQTLAVVTEDGPEIIEEPAPAVTEDESEAAEEPDLTVTAQTEVDDRQSPPRRADARRRSAKRDLSTASMNRIAPPEVALPHEIYSALRSLTLDERSADPTKARSYGQVVLDAVEEHAHELQAHWSSAVASSGTGLFKRAEAGKPTRRRHNAPQARVPLAGVINSDAAVLDQLASDWGAGSRSALVEQALRLYLRVN